MTTRYRVILPSICVGFLLAGCRPQPIMPTAGSDNSWQLVTTYTIPSGQWYAETSVTHVNLRAGTPGHPNFTIGAFAVPRKEIVTTVTDSMAGCKPTAACRLVDSNRVHVGQADTILWYAVNRGDPVAYDLYVLVATAAPFTVTSTPADWRPGEEFEVDVNAVANSYRVAGVVHGKQVGFWVKDSVDDSSKKLVAFISRTDIPGPGKGPVAQRNFLYRLLN